MRARAGNDWSSTSSNLLEMLQVGCGQTVGSRKTGGPGNTASLPPAGPRVRLQFPQGPGAHTAPATRPAPPRLSTGGDVESPPPPRRNRRGLGAACFLFVGRGDMAAAPPAAGAGSSRGRRSAATAAAWGSWGGRPQPGNILLQLRQGQLTGRGLVRAVQVRGQPGGAGRGGPVRGWPGAGREAFPGRCGTGQVPLG